MSDWIDRFYEENAVVEPKAAADWLTDEQRERIPIAELERRNYYYARGDAATKQFLHAVRLEEFNAEVGPLLDELEPGEEISLNTRIWQDFIKEQFRGDPNLQVPEPFEFANTETEFWTMGFQRHLERVHKAAKSWK